MNPPFFDSAPMDQRASSSSATSGLSLATAEETHPILLLTKLEQLHTNSRKTTRNVMLCAPKTPKDIMMIRNELVRLEVANGISWLDDATTLFGGTANWESKSDFHARNTSSRMRKAKEAELEVYGHLSFASTMGHPLLIIGTGVRKYVHFSKVMYIAEETDHGLACQFSLLLETREELQFICGSSSEYLQWIDCLQRAFKDVYPNDREIDFDDRRSMNSQASFYSTYSTQSRRTVNQPGRSGSRSRGRIPQQNPNIRRQASIEAYRQPPLRGKQPPPFSQYSRQQLAQIQQLGRRSMPQMKQTPPPGLRDMYSGYDEYDDRDFYSPNSQQYQDSISREFPPQMDRFQRTKRPTKLQGAGDDFYGFEDAARDTQSPKSDVQLRSALSKKSASQKHSHPNSESSSPTAEEVYEMTATAYKAGFVDDPVIENDQDYEERQHRKNERFSTDGNQKRASTPGSKTRAGYPTRAGSLVRFSGEDEVAYDLMRMSSDGSSYGGRGESLNRTTAMQREIEFQQRKEAERSVAKKQSSPAMMQRSISVDPRILAKSKFGPDDGVDRSNPIQQPNIYTSTGLDRQQQSSPALQRSSLYNKMQKSISIDPRIISKSKTKSDDTDGPGSPSIRQPYFGRSLSNDSRQQNSSPKQKSLKLPAFLSSKSNNPASTVDDPKDSPKQNLIGNIFSNTFNSKKKATDTVEATKSNTFDKRITADEQRREAELSAGDVSASMVDKPQVAASSSEEPLSSSYNPPPQSFPQQITFAPEVTQAQSYPQLSGFSPQFLPPQTLPQIIAFDANNVPPQSSNQPVSAVSQSLSSSVRPIPPVGNSYVLESNRSESPASLGSTDSAAKYVPQQNRTKSPDKSTEKSTASVASKKVSKKASLSPTTTQRIGKFTLSPNIILFDDDMRNYVENMRSTVRKAAGNFGATASALGFYDEEFETIKSISKSSAKRDPEMEDSDSSVGSSMKRQLSSGPSRLYIDGTEPPNSPSSPFSPRGSSQVSAAIEGTQSPVQRAARSARLSENSAALRESLIASLQLSSAYQKASTSRPKSDAEKLLIAHAALARTLQTMEPVTLSTPTGGTPTILPPANTGGGVRNTIGAFETLGSPLTPASALKK